MSRALLITSFPSAHVEAKLVPGFAAYGWTVARVETPRFDGPIEGVSALFMIEQMTSENERRDFRARCHKARVAFVVLPSERSKWPALMRDLGVPKPAEREPEREPAPAPAAPPAPPPPRPPVAVPAPAAPRPPPPPPLPAPPPAPAPPAPPAPEPITYGAWLREKRGDTAAAELGALLGVSDSLVTGWEQERCGIAADHLAALKELYGEPPALVLPPKPTLRTRHVPRSAALPAAAPVELPTPYTNGHAAVAPLSSLKGLRKAARALRIDGDVVVTGRDDGATVTVGAEKWPGADEDEAVATARRDLDGRLRAWRREFDDALASLGGAS